MRTSRCQQAQRGVPLSGLWSEGEIASSGTGSERAQVASVCYEEAARAPWHREGKRFMESAR